MNNIEIAAKLQKIVNDLSELINECTSSVNVLDRKITATEAMLAAKNSTIGKSLADTISRTTQPNCPACKEQRLHTEEEWAFHPQNRTGVDLSAGRSLKKDAEK
jgi:hypothetical protein